MNFFFEMDNLVGILLSLTCHPKSTLIEHVTFYLNDALARCMTVDTLAVLDALTPMIFSPILNVG